MADIYQFRRPSRFPGPPRSTRNRRGFRLAAFALPILATGAAVVAGWLLTTTPDITGPVAFFAEAERGELLSPARISVVDGDTVRVGGRLTRLVGFNTPETFEPACAAERRLGKAAESRLRDLVRSGNVGFAEVACACQSGTEGTARCNYGRACGVLHVDGRDVGETLMSEGLAVRFVCGGTGCPPTPRPWCSG